MFPSIGMRDLSLEMGPAFRGGLLNTPAAKPRTYAYIDGFNLYYGFYKDPNRTHWAKYKWLDIEKLCDTLFPKNDVVAIKYYTADVSNRLPDYKQNHRQQAYLKALSTLSRVEIIKGRFVGPRLRWMPQCDQNGNPLGSSVPVLRTEEKGSDVNLAVDLLHDCVLGRYDCAVIISNDSDLTRAIRIVRDDYGKTIGIVNPHRRQIARQLRGLAHFRQRVSEPVLASSQLPDEVALGAGVIRRPPSWS